MKLLTIGIILAICLIIGLCGSYLDKPLMEGLEGGGECVKKHYAETAPWELVSNKNTCNDVEWRATNTFQPSEGGCESDWGVVCDAAADPSNYTAPSSPPPNTTSRGGKDCFIQSATVPGGIIVVRINSLYGIMDNVPSSPTTGSSRVIHLAKVVSQ